MELAVKLVLVAMIMFLSFVFSVWAVTVMQGIYRWAKRQEKQERRGCGVPHQGPCAAEDEIAG